jgi:hypothetical protein
MKAIGELAREALDDLMRRLLLAIIGVNPCCACPFRASTCEGWPRCLPWEVDAALAACPAVPFEDDPSFPPPAAPRQSDPPCRTVTSTAGGGTTLEPPGSVRSAGPGGSDPAMDAAIARDELDMTHEGER